jgi:HSP20 family molecular chaperone IbpA
MSTLNLWQDPFADVEQLVRTVFGAQPDRPQGWTPASEVFRDGDDALVQIELPGLDVAKDVTVEIERGHLVVRGERRPAGDGVNQRATVRERRYGSFRRVFRLPDHVGPEHLGATYDAGILTVRVSGAYAPPAPHKVTISTGAPVSIDASSTASTGNATTGITEGSPKPGAGEPAGAAQMAASGT